MYISCPSLQFALKNSRVFFTLNVVIGFISRPPVPQLQLAPSVHKEFTYNLHCK